jgi:hypothetical protein
LLNLYNKACEEQQYRIENLTDKSKTEAIKEKVVNDFLNMMKTKWNINFTLLIYKADRDHRVAKKIGILILLGKHLSRFLLRI